MSERIRIWLRLEDLFDKALYFCRSMDDARCHHAGLLAIFEIVDVLVRAEIKTEMLQELERQKHALETLRTNPQVDARRLDQVLIGIAAAHTGLLAMTGKMGQHVRENEWLASIRGRACIPGGTCSFDLPVYHYWLNQTADERRVGLLGWLSPMLPLKQAVDVLLKLLREGGHTSSHIAVQGQFQLMLGGRSAQMLRLSVDAGCAPEVSANKYAVNIRFLVPDVLQKPHVCDTDIAFDLVFCNF